MTKYTPRPLSWRSEDELEVYEHYGYAHAAKFISGREHQIIYMRMTGRTYVTIAKSFNVTDVRIRQIYLRSVRKVIRYVRTHKL